MANPPLQVDAQSPATAPAGPTLSDGYEQQALGRLQGPAAQKAKDILKKLAELAKDTAEREAIMAAIRGVSAVTAAGIDESPIGPVVVGAELGGTLWEAYKLAQNAKKLAELLLLLRALANVQIQKEKKKAKDCEQMNPGAGQGIS